MTRNFATSRAPAVIAGLVFALAAGFAQAALPDFTTLVKQNGAAVVNISTTQTLQRESRLPPGLEMPQLPEGSPWEDLFRHFFGERDGMPEQYEARSLGSGFIIDESGYILTNNHVVESSDEIIVRLSDRRELVAELIGSDPRSDIALLKVDAKGLPVVAIGEMASVEVGEWVLAIGSPFGFDHSVSVGVVSALGRSLPSESYVPFIQTDVAINPGNSGGPLFDLDGRVIGINSQIYSRTGGYMGVSFAIPIDVAMNVAKQLRDKGFVSRGWLGVLIQDVTRELAESFGMKKPAGALVAQVVEDSPAAKAGLQVGDVIVSYEGASIGDSSELPPLVGRTNVGDTAKLKVIRNGKEIELGVRIGELPAEDEIARTTPGRSDAEQTRLGLTVEDLSSEQREQLELGNVGVIVKDMDAGPAREAGIRPGDVIVKLNNIDIESARHFREVVDELPGGKTVPILIRRQSGPIFLALRVPEER